MNQRSMRSMSSMKSTIAARFLSMKDLRAAQMMICETPIASLLVNSSARDLACSSGSNENGSTAGMRSAFFSVSIAFMVGNGASTHGVVALVLQAVLAQHRARRDIDGAADGVGGDTLPLRSSTFLIGPSLQHRELVAVIAVDAVLEFVGDDAQIVEVGVLDRERKVE